MAKDKPSDWKTGYKIIWTFPGQEMENGGTSAWARGKASIEYRKGKLIRGKKFMAKKSKKEIRLPIMLYENLKEAKKYLNGIIQRHAFSIWMVRYIPGEPIIPGKWELLRNGYYKPDKKDEGFQDGTVFAEKLVLVRKVYENGFPY